MSDSPHTASAFASALDADDFVRAKKLLAPDCLYAFRDTRYEGPDAIIDTYRAASAWARFAFDAIAYESQVEVIDSAKKGTGSPRDGEEVCAITFIDHLTHRGDHHTHRCRQIIQINDQNLIDRITHEDLPGEREAAEVFMTRHGISR